MYGYVGDTPGRPFRIHSISASWYTQKKRIKKSGIKGQAGSESELLTVFSWLGFDSGGAWLQQKTLLLRRVRASHGAFGVHCKAVLHSHFPS
jgi:hypothetical protein